MIGFRCAGETLFALAEQTKKPGDTIAAKNRDFSLIVAPGWRKRDSNFSGGVNPALAVATEMADNTDILLIGPQSTWGTNSSSGQTVTGPAALNVTHIELPNGITLEKFRTDSIAAEVDAAEWTEYRPERASRVKIDGHDAIQWQTTESLNGITIKVFESSVLVGPQLVYDFTLESSTEGFPSALKDLQQMLRSAKFK
jgi:cellobiose-specific phosphotransferase system component IIB